MTSTTKEIAMTHQEYAARVNQAAGTDIDILEDAYLAAMEEEEPKPQGHRTDLEPVTDGYRSTGEDFEEAGRLIGHIYACRTAAGLDPVTGHER